VTLSEALAVSPNACGPLAIVGLVVVGALASGINAVAGGGSLLSFPALIALGLPPIPANATNSVALWPGSLAGAIGFHNHLRAERRWLLTLMPPNVVGAALGAWLLLNTPAAVFRVAVPGLILFATLLLAFQPTLRARVRAARGHVPLPVGAAIQFLIAVYGGYFGAGMGILMLAYLGLMSDGTIHEMNAVKQWLGLAINLVASIIFLSKGLVWWAPGLALTGGAVLGGYAAAKVSPRVDSDRMRQAIVVLGFAMAVWFTIRLGAA